jgi:hypothetical protein
MTDEAATVLTLGLSIGALACSWTALFRVGVLRAKLRKMEQAAEELKRDMEDQTTTWRERR